MDLVAVVADAAVTEVFENVETALNRLSPVALRCDRPAGPGCSQKFYRLRGASESLVVDLVFLRRGDPLMFRDVALQGQGHTLLLRCSSTCLSRNACGDAQWRRCTSTLRH